MDFKNGDRVFYHSRPGEVDSGIISNLEGAWKPGLYKTREEAEEALSRDAQRLVGCFAEAREVFVRGLVGYYSGDKDDLVVKIAFKLFDEGGD